MLFTLETFVIWLLKVLDKEGPEFLNPREMKEWMASCVCLFNSLLSWWSVLNPVMDWLVRTYQTWHWLVVRGSFSQDPNVLFLQAERKFAHEEFILFLHWKFCVWLLKVLEKQRPKVSESKRKEKNGWTDDCILVWSTSVCAWANSCCMPKFWASKHGWFLTPANSSEVIELAEE